MQISTPLDSKGHGDPAGITVIDEQGRVTLSTSATFNDDGMPLTETDELGRQLSYSYAAQNPLGLPDGVTVTLGSPADGALGTVHRALHYDKYGRLTGIDEAETGASASWSYDSQGRKVSSSQQGTPPQVFRYAYTPVGDAQKASFAPVVDDMASLATTSLVIVTETLDGTEHERKQFFADGLLLGESFKYGASGAVGTRKNRYTKGRLSSSTDERGFVRAYTYDADGRLKKVEATDAGGVARTEVEYALDSEGRPTAVTGSDGQVTGIEYDILGQAAKWDYGLADAQGAARDVESVTRDVRGALTQRTFGSGAVPHVLTTSLDGVGRPLAMNSAEGSAGGVHEVRQYDGQGRPTLVRDDEVGLKDEYEYKDVLGRMTLHTRTVMSGTQALVDTESRSYEDRAATATETGLTLVHVTHRIATGLGTRTKKVDVVQDPAGRVLSSTEFVPDAMGTPQSAMTSYTYDPRGNLLTMTEPLAPVATADGTGTDTYSRTSSYTYDGLGNRLTATLSDGARVAFTPNAAGQVERRVGPHPDDVWDFKYDHLGRLTQRKVTHGEGSTAAAANWTVVYGPSAQDGKQNALGAGQVSQTDPAGYTTVATLNARGKLLRQVADDKGVSRGSTNQQVSEFGYDGPFTRAQTVTEGSASVGTTTRTFDDRGRVTVEHETWTKGSNGYEYQTTSPWSGRTVTIDQKYNSGPKSLELRTQLEVDSQGKVTTRTRGSYGESVTDSWLYDAGGLLTRESLSRKPERVNTYVEGLLSQSEYGGLETTGYSYYQDGRLQAVSYPSGRMRTSYWNRRGLLDQETYGAQGELQRTRYTYDAGGHLSSLVQGFTTSDQAERQYVNGPMGETLSVTLPGQAGSFAYGYDGARRLVSLTPPADSAMPVQSFDWDFLGRPAVRLRGGAKWTMEWADGEVTETNPESDQTVRQYDPRGRVAHVQLKPGPSTLENTELTETTWALGGDNQPMQVEETRKSGNVRTTYDYDPIGRVQAITRGQAMVSYGYTPSSQRERVTSPSGTTIYGYDGFDRLHTLTSAQGPSVMYEWEPGGELLLSIQGGGLIERRCYDARGRMTQLVHASGDGFCAQGAPPPGLVSSYAYAYDERGNRSRETYVDGQMLPETTNYGYDLADRLTGVVGPGPVATFYKIGGDGSRLGEKRSVNWVGAANAAYESVGGASEIRYVFDARGGLAGITDPSTGGSVATFVTDRAGRLVVEQRGGSARNYFWDADSRLARVTVSGTNGSMENRYQYDAQGLRRAKTGATGVGYLWAGNELVEEQPATGASVVYAQGTDGTVVGLGSARALHDGLGSVSGRDGAAATLYRTDAWGNSRTDPGDASHWTAPPPGGPSIGFGATHWDADAGLSYAQQRWYDPATGRWLSEDPVFGDLKEPMSLNLWAYANGNPTRYTDATGERSPTREEVDRHHYYSTLAEEMEARHASRTYAGKAFGRAIAAIGQPNSYSMAKALRKYDLEFAAAIERAQEGEKVVKYASTHASHDLRAIRDVNGEYIGEEDFGQHWYPESEIAGERDLEKAYAGSIASKIDFGIEVATVVGAGAGARLRQERAALPESSLRNRRLGPVPLAPVPEKSISDTRSPFQRSIESAGVEADRGQAAGREKGKAAALVIGDDVLSSQSSGRDEDAGPSPHQPGVQRALDLVPSYQRSLFHGECAEIFNFDAAELRGLDTRGGMSAAANIRKSGKPGHRRSACACSTCGWMNSYYGVMEAEPRVSSNGGAFSPRLQQSSTAPIFAPVWVGPSLGRCVGAPGECR